MAITLYPKSKDPVIVAYKQKENILRRLQSIQFKKDTQSLETALNEFFYSKTGENHNKYYERAMKLAADEFNKIYSSYSFDAEKMTAKFKNSNIHFLDKRSEPTLQQVKQMAIAIEKFLDDNNSIKRREEWFTILAKIKNLQNLSEWSDVKDLNGIIASIMFGNKTVYGDAFEYPLAAFSTLLQSETEKISDDLLTTLFEKNLQGGQSSKSRLDISKVSKQDRQTLKINNSIPINEGTILEYHNPSKDKVDVTLTFNNIDFNISAKSYSSIYKKVHILGGAALTTPVLNLSSEDFISHYLTELYKENGNLTALHDAVRLNILFTALTGAGNSNTQADTFVFNDKQHRHIYVRSMPDIISYIANTHKWSDLDINNGGSEIPDSPLRQYSSHKEIAFQNTIGSMLSKMHTIKLQVSIKGGGIKNAVTNNLTN